MKRVTQIGDIVLDNSLFLKETFGIKNVKAKSFYTLEGGIVVFESIKRGSANNITLESLDSGWQKGETIEEIVQLANNLNVTTTIILDGVTVNARFRLEDEEPIAVEQLYEGSNWYKVVIKMAYV